MFFLNYPSLLFPSLDFEESRAMIHCSLVLDLDGFAKPHKTIVFSYVACLFDRRYLGFCTEAHKFISVEFQSPSYMSKFF